MRRAMIAAVLVATVGLAGCVNVEGTGKGEVVSTGLTWQEAKASTQRMEMEISALIPQEVVSSVEQQEKGMLWSCNKTRHRWKGSTTITVVEGTEIEPIVKAIEAHYQGSKFEVGTRLNVAKQYEVQLIAPDGVENYIIAEGFEPNKIRIASGSACFTSPEDEYLGGNF